MKYRKRPIVVEAFKEGTEAPVWALKAYSENVICYNNAGDLVIITPEGEMRVNKDDWIIQGVNGEIYPCKPDIFEKTYEEILDDTNA